MKRKVLIIGYVAAAVIAASASADPAPSGVENAFMQMQYALYLDSKCHILDNEDRTLIENNSARTAELLAQLDASRIEPAKAGGKQMAEGKTCEGARDDITDIVNRTRLASHIIAMQKDPNSVLNKWRNYMEAFAINRKCNYLDGAMTNRFAVMALQKRALFPPELKTPKAKQEFDGVRQTTLQMINDASKAQICDSEAEKLVRAQAAQLTDK